MKTVEESYGSAINMANKHAEEYYDGHFTLMGFTTNWRFSFGTIDDRDEVEGMYFGEDLEELVTRAIIADLKKRLTGRVLPPSMKEKYNG